MAISLLGNSIFTTGVNVTAISATVPGGIQAGDYLVFSINTRGTSATCSTPTGFTSYIDAPRAANGRHYVFGKVADGSETTVSSTCAFNGSHAAILLLLRGVDIGTPVNISNSATGGTNSVHTAPAVTTTVNGCYIINFADTALTGTFDYNWSPGTSIVQAKSTIGGVDNVLGSAYMTKPLAGATTTDVATMSSGSAGSWVASTVALAPAGAALSGLSVLQGISTLQF